MASATDWMPSRLADMLVMFQNVLAKIGGYKTILPITTGQVDRIVLICEEFVAVYTYVVQARATTESLVEWRDLILKGSPAGDAAPAPPVYPTYTVVTDSFIGILTEFRELRDVIVASPGYTTAIGEDLMIVKPATEKLVEADAAPELKVATAAGYEVTVSGSMQGMDAMRVEYQRAGSATWATVAFLTKTPGTFTITPATPGTPENGRIRAVFIKKNEQFGNFSPEYPVTLS
ncbi:MAG TPA: hypothetical protein PLL77_03505 [Pyrinomonadaceae bacterium]|nr:hypothetical protein [Pyrinomonadaceae bacterium]